MWTLSGFIVETSVCSVHLIIRNVWVKKSQNWDCSHPDGKKEMLILFKIVLFDTQHTCSNKFFIERIIILFWYCFKTALSYFQSLGIMIKVFTNGPGDQGSIPGRVISKTQKWYLHCKLRIKGKWRNPGKRLVSSPIHQCSSYWKGSL